MNKLGYHVNTWTSAARGTVRTQRNGLILKVLSTAVDPGEILSWREHNPHGLVLYRHYIPDESLDDVPGRVEQVIRGGSSIRHLIDIVEAPWNESHQTIDGPGVQGGIDSYARATLEATALLKHHWPHVKVAVGNFSVGNPPVLWTDWQAYAPALETADYLSLHEYGSPYVWSGPGNAAELQGAGALTEGWWTLRYRKVYAWLTQNHPSLVRPLLITECGRDHGLTHVRVDGWRAHGGGDPARFATEMRWYAQQLAADAYVHGATIFACGTYADFASFDVGGVGEIERLCNEPIAGGRLITPTPPPAPTPPAPTPSPAPVPVPAPDTSPDMALERYAADIFRRAGSMTGQPIHFNPDGALCRYWVSALADERFLGVPMEPEHPTEDGEWIEQAFSCAILRWHRTTGAVNEIGYRRPLDLG